MYGASYEEESGVSYGIDFLTALPPSGPHRYTWCMVVKDHFSGYTHILPWTVQVYGLSLN